MCVKRHVFVCAVLCDVVWFVVCVFAFVWAWGLCGLCVCLLCLCGVFVNSGLRCFVVC